MDNLELKTLDALALLAVAHASRDQKVIVAAKDRLWEVGSRLCRDRRGEALAGVLTSYTKVVSSTPALVYVINYFAACNNAACRARLTPLGGVN